MDFNNCFGEPCPSVISFKFATFSTFDCLMTIHHNAAAGLGPPGCDGVDTMALCCRERTKATRLWGLIRNGTILKLLAHCPMPHYRQSETQRQHCVRTECSHET